MDKKRAPGERMLAPSTILRETPRGAGGWRHRESIVRKCGAIIREGSKSFYMASLLFDRETRERVWMLYAWCRRCDDLADAQDMGGTLGNQSKIKDRVKAIRVLTRRALNGEPTADLAFDAFGRVAVERGLTLPMAEEVIAGFQLDADDWRPRTTRDLLRYCYHVAGAVGVMMAIVMGVDRDNDEVLDRACDLGFAFQLANIARDLEEDDAADRCYLPVEWLVEEDIEPGQLMKPHHRQEVVDLTKRLVDLARTHRAAALAGTHALKFRQRWAIHAAARIYGGIAEKVAERGTAAWDSRVYVPRIAKLGHVAAAFFAAMRKDYPMPDPAPVWSRRDFVTRADAAPMEDE